jgi:hypothetical protein
MITAQQKFFDDLNFQKESSPDGREKMPLVCIAGYLDFDALKEEVRLSATCSNMDFQEASGCPSVARPGEPSDLPTVALDSTEVTQAIPSFVNVPNVVGEFIPVPKLDERQSASMIEHLEFCGAQVFRALSLEYGFIFA